MYIFEENCTPNQNNFISMVLSNSASMGFTVKEIDTRYILATPANISVKYYIAGPITPIYNVPAENTKNTTYRIFEYKTDT